MTSRTFRLRAFAHLRLACCISFTIAACQSTTSDSPGNAVPETPSGTESHKSLEQPANLEIAPNSDIDATTLLRNLAGIEVNFSKDNCPGVMEFARKLYPLQGKKGQPWLPPFAQVAVFYCDAELNPRDAEKTKLAIATINDAKQRLGLAADTTWLDILKARRYLAQNDRAGALAAKRSARDTINAKGELALQLESEILELSSGTELMNPRERTLFKDALLYSQKDEKLFVALKLVDQLIIGSKQLKARDLLSQHRKRIVARIEELFALEASQIEQKMATGREAEGRAQAQEMKARFPGRDYASRIDGLLGLSSAVKNNNATANSQDELTSATKLNSEPALPNTSATPDPQQKTIAEKAFAEAREQIDAGEFSKAVDTLDAVPEAEKNEKLRKLRREAMEQDVRKMRQHVRELYDRSRAESRKAEKLKFLGQAKQTLELIIARYPDNSARRGVNINLKSISIELAEIEKGK